MLVVILIGALLILSEVLGEMSNRALRVKTIITFDVIRAIILGVCIALVFTKDMGRTVSEKYETIVMKTNEPNRHIYKVVLSKRFYWNQTVSVSKDTFEHITIGEAVTKSDIENN